MGIYMYSSRGHNCKLFWSIRHLILGTYHSIYLSYFDYISVVYFDHELSCFLLIWNMDIYYFEPTWCYVILTSFHLTFYTNSVLIFLYPSVWSCLLTNYTWCHSCFIYDFFFNLMMSCQIWFIFVSIFPVWEKHNLHNFFLLQSLNDEIW